MVLDVDDGRVLQVFLRTDGGLCTIRVVREEGAHDCLNHLLAIESRVHVTFFVHGLQFGVESTDHQVLETVCLNLRPVLNLVARNVFHVASHIVAGIGIGTTGTDSGHQLVVFIRDEVSGSFVRKAVDNVIDGLAFGLICRLAIDFELCLDGIEKRLFGFVVHGSVLLCTLEHEVFQVVRQTGGFGWVVLTAHTYSDVGLYAWSFLIHGHVNLQSIAQGVHLGIHRVIGYGGVLILAARTGRKHQATHHPKRQAQGLEIIFHCCKFK